MRGLVLALVIALPMPALAQDETAAREDRDRITAFLEDNLSGAGREVILEGFKGALSSRATATRLTIADREGVWLTLNDIVLDWNRASLLRGAVSVNELSAAEIIVARAPVADRSVPSPEASGFTLPELPVSLDIEKLSANRVVLGEPLLGQSVEGTIVASAALSGGQGNASIDIDRTDSGPDGRLSLAASFDNDSRRLSLSLDVNEAPGGIAATLLTLPGAPSVELIVNGGGPLDDFATTVDLVTDGEERLKGLLTLKGASEGATRFSADLGGDLAPLFLPQYAAFFGTSITLKASGERRATGAVSLSELDLKTRSLELIGSALIAADGLPSQFELRGQLQDPDGVPVVIPGADGVTLSSADLDIGYDTTQGETWRARVSASNVDAPQGRFPALALRGSGRIERQGDGVHVGGTLTASATDIALTDASLQQALGSSAEARGQFWWQQADDGLALSGVRLTAGDLSALISGTIKGLRSGFGLEGKAEVRADDLGRFSGLVGRPISGSGKITIEGQGSPLGGDFDVRLGVEGDDLGVSQAQLDDFLAGRSSLAADLRRDGTGTELRSFSLRTTGLSADGQGRLGSDQSQIGFVLAAPDLAKLGPNYAGALSGQIDLTGAVGEGQAELKAQLSGQGLRVGVPEVERLLEGASTITLNAGLSDRVLTVDTFTLAASGLDAAATGRLSETDNQITAEFSLADLGLVLAGRSGRIAAKATFSGLPENATVRLDATTTNLRIGQAEADRVLAGQSSVEADLRIVDGLLRIDDARLKNPQLTATAKGRVGASERQIDLEARLANLALLLPDFPGAVTLQGRAVEQGRGYQLTLSGTGPGGIDARVNGTLAADFASADLAVVGSAQAGLANPFLGTRRVSGPVRADLRLAGPIGLNALSGTVRLSDGRLADPSLPFNLQGIQANVVLGRGQARLDGSAQVSTGGTVTLGGTVGLSGPYPSDLAIGLRAVTVQEPEVFKARLNGDLALKGPLVGGSVLSGRIAVPEAEVLVSATGLGATGDLPDLKHQNEPAPVRETRRRAGMLDAGGGAGAQAVARPYTLDLLISAPNRLFVRGRGLDAELGGELRISGTTDNVIPSGSFNLIRGRLEILGRRLDLSEALLQLEGGFDPSLRIVASTEADGITAGVLIEGQATDPQVTFTSSPELPQEEILAQILFGKRLENLSAFQALQLANAVATLAGRGGEGIVSRLRRGFGLDDLDVQTADDGSAQLKAGKYLSENVYTEVIVGQSGKTEINLNLDLNKTLTLKGKVGADGDTGIGLFFEKDY